MSGKMAGFFQQQRFEAMHRKRERVHFAIPRSHHGNA